MLTCQPLVTSTYKERHPEDTDDPGAVGVSSKDEAEGMGEVLGISRRLQKPEPSPAESSTVKLGSATPSDPATPVVPEEEGIIRVKRKDLRRHSQRYSGREESEDEYGGLLSGCPF